VVLFYSDDIKNKSLINKKQKKNVFDFRFKYILFCEACLYTASQMTIKNLFEREDMDDQVRF
jgi:hypothetical protein